MVDLVVGTLRLALLVVLLAEGAARAGTGFLLFFPHRHPGPLERFGLSFLGGLAVISAGFLGLALCGLFYPGLLLILTGVLVLASFAACRELAPLLPAALRDAGPRACAVAALLLFPALRLLLSPETEQDSLIYHLGLPWQYLQAHRALFYQVSNSFHLFLPAEMTFALPLVLGDERLAKWIGVLAFAAANAVFAGMNRGTGTARWLGPLLALAGGYVLWLMARAKGDLLGASWLVTGVLLILRGGWSLGAVLVGFGIASKIVYAPLAVFLISFRPPPLKKTWVVAAGLAAGLLPWLSKSWLATGNPLFPFLSSVFPSLDWGPDNVAALNAYARGVWHADTFALPVLPVAWLKYMARDYSLGLAATGVLLAFRRTRSLGAACALGQIAALGLGHMPRYMLPGVWLAALAGSRLVDQLPGGRRRIAVGVLVVAALASIGLKLDRTGPKWRELAQPPGDLRAELLSTYDEAVRAAVALEPSRLLNIGELRTYPLPGRVIYGGALGETPLVWRLVREAPNPERLAVKFRQLGASLALYNYVSVKWVQRYYGSGFEWDERMLDLYTAFCRRYLKIALGFKLCDFTDGGFYLLEFRAKPRSRAASPLYFLPGAEGAYAKAVILRTDKDYRRGIEELKPLVKRFPDVLAFRAEMGYMYAKIKEFGQAYDTLRPLAALDIMDSTSLPTYAMSAHNLGKNEEALELLREALPRFPPYEREIRIGIATISFGKALTHAYANEMEPALDWLTDALVMLDFPVDSPKPTVNLRHRQRLAQAKGLRADLHMARREFAQARKLYLEAYGYGPDVPGADGWKRKADGLPE